MFIWVMCKNSKTKWVIIFDIVFIVGVILACQYCWASKEEAKAQKEKILEEMNSKVEIVNWKIYRNEEYGFEISYPENFLLKEHKPYKNEFVIEIVEKEWENPDIHHPALFLSIVKTNLAPRDWLDEVFDPISEQKSDDPPHGYSDVEHNQINNMPVLQFKTWGASGSNDSMVIKKEPNLLYKLDAHHSCNGMFPKDIYNQMLSTFRFLIG